VSEVSRNLRSNLRRIVYRFEKVIWQDMKLSKFYIPLGALVLIVLGGSIFLNFRLYNQAKKYYFELNETRLDPVGLGYYPANPQGVTDTNQFRVVFFGDSRSASWTSPTLNGYEFINRGIGSQTSVQTRERFSSHVRPLKPNVVVIQVGINDLKTIGLFPERREEIVSSCKANIKRIVAESRSLGAVAILTTIFPAGEVPLERKPFWSDEIGKAVKEVNAYIATLADDKTIVFDTFSLLADRQGVMLSQYRVDELHYNEQAYVMLNKELVQLINTVRQRTVQS
jgi:lysophospholipase L1-like esterase